MEKIDWLITFVAELDGRLPQYFLATCICVSFLWPFIRDTYSVMIPNEDSKWTKRVVRIVFAGVICYILIVINYAVSIVETPKNPALNKTFYHYQELIERENNGENVVFLKDSTWKVITEIAVEDNKKRKAVFDVGILAMDYFWKRGSIDIINKRDSFLTHSLKNLLSSVDFKGRMKSSKGIICIGNASFEVIDSTIKNPGKKINDIMSEEKRANERARILAATINENLENNIPIYTASIGKCKVQNRENSDLQRSIVILSLKKYDEGVDINIAGFRAIVGLKSMPFRVIEYSLVSPDFLNIIKAFN